MQRTSKEAKHCLPKAKSIVFLAMAALLISALISGCRGKSDEDFISEVKGSLKFGMSLAEAVRKTGDIGEETKIGRYRVYHSESTVLGVQGYKYIIFDSSGGIVGIVFSYKPDKILKTEDYDTLIAHFADRVDIIKEVYGEPEAVTKNQTCYSWSVSIDNFSAKAVYKYPLAQSKDRFVSEYLVGSLIEEGAYANIAEAIGASALVDKAQ